MAQLATINPLNQFFALDGSPLNNGKLYFGEINADPEQNPVQMYWDSAGLVPALQPIRTTSGYPSRSGSPAILYCAVEYSLRVRQSNDVQVFYLPRAGSVGLQTFGQWEPTEVTPSYASANSFTMTGDQTAEFTPNRRARFSVTDGTVYGTISTAVYGALTTVAMIMDGAQVLDAGLSAVDLSILTSENQSLPGAQVIHVRDEKATGTVGGTSNSGNQLRVLNTVVVNTITGASLSANEVTLPAGKYRVDAVAPAVSAGRHRLSVGTGSTNLARGTSEYTIASGTTQTVARVFGRFTIAVSSVISLNHYIEAGRATDGLGLAVNDGEVEIYAQMFIIKE